MDSSSSEFRYDGGEEVVGGGNGIVWYAVVVSIVALILLTFLILSYTGVLNPSWTAMSLSSDQKAYIVANYKLENAPTATQGVCKMDAVTKKFTCTAPTEEVDPTTGAVKAKATTENLSVIWKDKMLSSGSDSAWGKSMYRGEGMCGQC